ncbi:right-handed parallel beta-helix repeat-containing protein [Amycolatopsis japonica]|uniref:right-handed parallel beta-helix repeat-containing protein n=1 Tax=Amycolatopsis japonica TaxID=208439 RepID=UPI003327C3F5
MSVSNLPEAEVPAEEITTGGLSGRIYYVDSVAGDDKRQGTTSDKPLRTLDRLNQIQFRPGDTIRFRRGQTFPGTFAPTGSGSAREPIVVTSYGSGGKPVLDGQGAIATVYLHNVQGWELRDLEITNLGPPPTPDEQRAGIFVLLEDFGIGRHYAVLNVDVHDVNGPDVLEPIPSGGIIFVAGGKATPTGFDGITVRDSTVSRTDRMGICTQSLWSLRSENPNGRGTSYVPMTNIVFRDNRLEDIGGDGIMINNGVGALVERNVLDNYGARAAEGTVVGLYGFNSDKGMFRHNSVTNGKLSSMAFDIETGNNGTVYEYNYSSRNNGGVLLTCNDPGSTSNDAVFRFNVSHDDRDGTGAWPVGVITLACGDTTNLRIHNNTIYAPNATKIVNNINVTAAEMTNNIFVGKADGSVINDPHGTYRNNVYHNVVLQQGSDDSAIEADPLFALADGVAASEHTWLGQLRAGSPALNAGEVPPLNGDPDHSADLGPKNIGAYQSDGVDPMP